MKSPTQFQQKVYSAVKKIPKGSVATYKLLAEEVGCGSYRAVGQALKKNPFAPDVPCHRVISSDLHVGGYQGKTDFSSPEIERKLSLLADENVFFENGRLIDEEKVVNTIP